MARFEIRVGRVPRLKMPEFTTSQMENVGEFAIVEMESRNAGGVNALGYPAKPLTTKYARAKARRGLRAIRDMHKTGKLLAAIGTAEASPAGVKVQIAQGEQRKAYINQNIDPWFGLSPENEESVLDNLKAVFGENVRRANQ